MKSLKIFWRIVIVMILIFFVTTFAPSLLSGSKAKAQITIPPGPFYVEFDWCCGYTSFPNCYVIVVKCRESGEVSCSIDSQLPCSMVCDEI
jgi:hypothetical protein